MKRILSIFLIIALSFSLMACTDSSTTQDPDTDTNSNPVSSP